MDNHRIEKKFVYFDLCANDGRKTELWRVTFRQGGGTLGWIRWRAGWRRYCFFPEPEILCDAECLRDIADVIEARMMARKA